MELKVGARLGPYEVLGTLGVGGMGEVYRARDTRLHRDVALKILPDRFMHDADRVARFQREAQVVASLNHPNIAAIHGLEDGDGIRALALEVVEGPTLAERIAASRRRPVGSAAPSGSSSPETLLSWVATGGLPFDEALSVARQIADALEAAHAKGVIHRDLKPANVKVRPDGSVKLLDFGLAKLSDPGDASDRDLRANGDGAGLPADAAIGASPTLSHLASERGLILGTAAYMSPEQARGVGVDKRSDIWAFGCVLYEMLTGCSAFPGSTVADMIAAILDREPDWRRLPDTTPSGIRRLLRRCLAKDPRRRLRDIGDARLEIDDSLAGASDTIAAVAGHLAAKPDVEFQRLTDFVGMKESPAVSPDGKMVAFVAVVGGRRQLWLRMLAGGASLQVSRDDADHEEPRWAPDSSTLIYCTCAAGSGDERALWEISALGGPPRRVIAAIGGGDISHDGQRIAVFQSAGEHVELVVAARDGWRKDCVITLPPEHLYSSPRWSPDGRMIAFQQASSSGFDMRLQIVSVVDGRLQEVARSEYLAGFSWLPNGAGLVYSSSCGSTLLYPPTMHLRTVGVDGRGDHRLTFGDDSHLQPDVHPSGRLVASRVRSRSDIWRFPTGGSPEENTRDAVRVTRQTGQAQTPSVSPDGTELVYLSDNGGHGNLWVARTDGSGVRQITFERDPAVAIGVPVWSPAGNWIVVIVTRGGKTGLWMVHPDGSGLHEAVRGWYACWSADGQWLYYTPAREGPRCLERVHVEGGTPEVVLASGGAGAAVSAGGSTLYFVHRLRPEIFGLWGDSEIQRLPLGKGPPEVLARIAASRVAVSPLLLQVFLSPDERWLAVPLMDGSTTNLWALPTAGGAMRPLTDFGDRSIVISRSVSWSADSRHLYAAVAETETDIVLFDGLIG
jgi:serine/threonine protein kinase/Tol biopolymer transport system component